MDLIIVREDNSKELNYKCILNNKKVIIKSPAIESKENTVVEIEKPQKELPVKVKEIPPKEIISQLTKSITRRQLMPLGDASGERSDKLIRSNLFCVKNICEKSLIKRPLIITGDLPGYYFSGDELNTYDFTIWLIMRREFFLNKKSERLTFYPYDILKFLEVSTSGSANEGIKKKIESLCSATITYNNIEYRLLENLEWHNTSSFTVSMNIKLEELFENNIFAYLDIEKIKSFKGSLSKWLYVYWSVSKRVYPINDNAIKLLCGSSCKAKDDWRRHLRKALKELVEKKFLKSFTFTRNGLVTPIRN